MKQKLFYCFLIIISITFTTAQAGATDRAKAVVKTIANALDTVKKISKGIAPQTICKTTEGTRHIQAFKSTTNVYLNPLKQLKYVYQLVAGTYPHNNPGKYIKVYWRDL